MSTLRTLDDEEVSTPDPAYQVERVGFIGSCRSFRFLFLFHWIPFTFASTETVEAVMSSSHVDIREGYNSQRQTALWPIACQYCNYFLTGFEKDGKRVARSSIWDPRVTGVDNGTILLVPTEPSFPFNFPCWLLNQHTCRFRMSEPTKNRPTTRRMCKNQWRLESVAFCLRSTI